MKNEDNLTARSSVCRLPHGLLLCDRPTHRATQNRVQHSKVDAGRKHNRDEHSSILVNYSSVYLRITQKNCIQIRVSFSNNCQ